MAPEEMATVVADPRLTNEAVRLILFVASRGPGAHEIDAEDLRVLLGCKSDTPVKAARRRAVSAGYLVVQAGGRDHGNAFTYTAPRSRLSDIGDSQEPPKPTVVEGEGDIPPNSPPLSFPARRAIDGAGEKLTGCRGSLVDYLTARVFADRQYAFVQTVLSWIDNPSQVFQQANGVLVPPHERMSLLAIALNELAASDESKYKAPSGDVRNLKNKLGVLAKGFGVKATGTDGGSGYRPRSGASDTQDYKPTDVFPGWNG